MRNLFALALTSASALLALAAFEQDGKAPAPDHESIVKEMLGVLEQITEGLKTVNDEPTALAAKAGLQQAAALWQQIRTKAEAVKPPGKEAKERLEPYADKFIIAQKQLFGQISRVISVPGGRELLKEVRTVLAPADKAKKPQP